LPLSIDTIEIKDFRNYKDFSFSPGSEISIVVGPNAVGKTNLIEAIQLVTAGESFRRPKWNEVVRQPAASAQVHMKASGEGEFFDVSLTVVDQRRSYAINGKKKRPIDLLGRMPSVVFTPDDLFMVKGPAEERRRTIDETGDQLSPGYARLRTTYARLLRQRNAALRAGVDDHQLDVMTHQIVEEGARLTAHRARLVLRMATKAATIYSGLSQGESLAVNLVPSWTKYGVSADAQTEEHAHTALSEAFTLSGKEEGARQSTLVGPHRDDLVFTIDGREARAYGSQGQQRSVALAWKLAEVGVIEDVLQRRPVLLLDDVMSELDKPRRDSLTELLSLTTQTVITTTNIQYFDSNMLERATVLELKR